MRYKRNFTCPQRQGETYQKRDMYGNKLTYIHMNRYTELYYIPTLLYQERIPLTTAVMLSQPTFEIQHTVHCLNSPSVKTFRIFPFGRIRNV